MNLPMGEDRSIGSTHQVHDVDLDLHFLEPFEDQHAVAQAAKSPIEFGDHHVVSRP